MTPQFGVTCFGLRVASYGLRVAGYGLRVSGTEFRVACYELRVSGYGLLDTGSSMLDPGYSTQIAGAYPVYSRCIGKYNDIEIPSCNLNNLFVGAASSLEILSRG